MISDYLVLVSISLGSFEMDNDANKRLGIIDTFACNEAENTLACVVQFVFAASIPASILQAKLQLDLRGPHVASLMISLLSWSVFSDPLCFSFKV